jgi:glycosyltransferase involved in cell wall biosynthesis
LDNRAEKVLILTYYWPPSGGAGVQRWVKFSRYLKELGYEPVVVTVDPVRASYALRDPSLEQDVSDVEVIRTATFEPFQMYKKLLGKKEIPYAGFANETSPGIMEKVSRFVRGNFFIPDARKGWNRYALPVARALIQEQGIRNLVTTSPPHSTQLMGLKLKAEFELNWIADLRDPWTDIYYYPLMYHTRWAASIDKKMEKSVLLAADQVTVVSDSIKRLYAAKLAAGEEKKIHVIPNGYDEKDFEGVEKTPNETFTITYTGTVADTYHLEGVFKALAGVASGNNFILRFVGRVSDKYKALATEGPLQGKVRFISHVKHAEAIRYMVSSDLLLLAIPDVPDNEGILTGKLFEYLAARVPVLGVGPVNGDAAAIIRECKAGEMFDYRDDGKIRSFLLKILKNFAGAKEEEKRDDCRRFSRRALTGHMAGLLR